MTEIKHENGLVPSEYLYDLLQRIKQRPGMYLGRCSITRLRMLIMGYSMSRGELGLPTTMQEKEFGKFQQWIQEKFKIASTQGWDSIILFFSADERDAFDKFYKLFEDFRNQESCLKNQFETENFSVTTTEFTEIDSKVPLATINQHD